MIFRKKQPPENKVNQRIRKCPYGPTYLRSSLCIMGRCWILKKVLDAAIATSKNKRKTKKKKTKDERVRGHRVF
jgi:hypothetical protein